MQSPTAPYWELMVLAFIAGIGGGAFSGFMPSTSYFFPRSKQGTALGLQAGIGNLGVSIVQLLTPYLIALGGLAVIGGSQVLKTAGKPDKVVWFQNAAFVWIPLMIIGALVAWTMLKSVPVKANIRQQFDIFANQDTWWMTLLYIMTFGTFSGLSAQFGLLMANLYGAGNAEIVQGAGASAQLLIEGYAVPDPVKFVFLGPLIGAVARFGFAPLTDKMGGAIWTLISGAGLVGSIAYTIGGLTPDTTSAATLNSGFSRFLYGMLAIFLFAGIGNASTFKQMPMIFERRQAGGVIGWTAAIAAFGPFLFGVGLNFLGAVPFYWVGVAWASRGPSCASRSRGGVTPARVRLSPADSQDSRSASPTRGGADQGFCGDVTHPTSWAWCLRHGIPDRFGVTASARGGLRAHRCAQGVQARRASSCRHPQDR